jgi:hypothetical protein
LVFITKQRANIRFAFYDENATSLYEGKKAANNGKNQ